MRTRFYLLTVLSSLGIYVSERLIQLHIDSVILKLGDSGVCASGEGFSCAELATSWLAEIAGIPIAVIGLAFYISALILAAIDRFKSQLIAGLPSLFVLGGLLSVVYSVFLMVMGKIEVGKFCPMCMGLYAVNIGLFCTALFTHPDGAKSGIAAGLKSFTQPAFWAAVLVLSISIPSAHFLSAKRFTQAKKKAVSIAKVDPNQKKESIDVGNSPFRGQKESKVVVIEFSDFECPYCKRLADSLKTALEREPDLFRYHFKHYPMDNACNRDIEREMHKNACTAAVAMVCANRVDKGWALHDKMFANQMDLSKENITTFAKDVGVDIERFSACMTGEKALAAVKKDIDDGIKAKVDGTPTWFINGIRIVGYRAPEEIIALATKIRDEQKKVDASPKPAKKTKKTSNSPTNPKSADAPAAP